MNAFSQTFSEFIDSMTIDRIGKNEYTICVDSSRDNKWEQKMNIKTTKPEFLLGLELLRKTIDYHKKIP